MKFDTFKNTTISIVRVLSDYDEVQIAKMFIAILYMKITRVKWNSKWKDKFSN